ETLEGDAVERGSPQDVTGGVSVRVIRADDAPGDHDPVRLPSSDDERLALAVVLRASSASEDVHPLARVARWIRDHVSDGQPQQLASGEGRGPPVEPRLTSVPRDRRCAASGRPIVRVPPLPAVLVGLRDQGPTRGREDLAGLPALLALT